MKRILIVGATSGIAMACARTWLEREGAGVEFYLVGRSVEKLAQCADDLSGRGAAGVTTVVADFADIGSYAGILDEALSSFERFDIALVAHGSLPDQDACSSSIELTAAEFEINATSAIAWLTALSIAMQSRAMSGSALAVISSVAGDRGRESNYLYGSAKAAVSTFCDGLRMRLAGHGIHVTDVRPGMVDTDMTRNMDLPGILVASPEEVAATIVRAIERKKAVVYAPGYWALIMLIIKLIPRSIFKRLKL